VERLREPMRAVVLVPARRGRRSSAEPGNGSAMAAVSATHSEQDRLAEAVGLARAIDLEVAAADLVPLAQLRPSTLFGSGKVEELAQLIAAHEAGLAIVDHALTPVQQRNLEKAWGCKVLDRTGLILEIFGARARTREGRLQVELAHLSYQKGRLVRTWTHLERQRGGFGFMGGPGEAQIETDRRLIDERIAAIRKELGVVVKTRSLHRAGRKRVPLPVVALVGYTNAGKSTLFNALTGARVSAKDQVFQTLDPTMREMKLPSGRRIILSDTVGFIADLPTLLVAAFRATLEEVVEADLILHVRDISHPETAAQQRDVDEVLSALHVASGMPLEVWNKADRLSSSSRNEARHAIARRQLRPVLVSALTGEGLGKLEIAIDASLGAADEILTVRVPAHAGRLLSWLHAHTEVLDARTADTGVVTTQIRIDAPTRGKLEGEMKRAGLELGKQSRAGRSQAAR
jgi:GTP-binding protein HflX